MNLDLQKKTFFLITGASRGIGKSFAIKISKKLSTGSVVALVARNEDRLTAVKNHINSSRGDELRVEVFPIDLQTATEEQFAKIINDALLHSRQAVKDFERAFIIHNAGTVGDISKRAIDVSDIDTWTQYFHTNLFSAISLNCEFFRVFESIPKLVVNMSSKCGIEPFASMSFYCTAKAAREMYFRVLAVESGEDTLVLNYAPGAIDTDMTVLVQQESINAELVNSFKYQRESNTMLTTEQTTNKFLKVLQEKKFKSGDHVDFWDEN